MAWNGGFSGVGYTRPEFRKFLLGQPKPPYHRVVIHNTDAPYMRPPVAPGQRVRNISVHYKTKGWSAGPDFFVFHDGQAYPGSPMGKSVGCKGWNGNSFHIEAEGKYTKKSGHDPLTGEGKAVWDTMAWVAAELLMWMGWPADDVHIKLHKEGNTTHKGCPGELISKPWFIAKVKEEMTQNPFYPENLTSKPVKTDPKPKPSAQVLKVGSTGGGVPTLQLKLRHLGFYKALVDGDFGKKTLEAVKAFQKAKGLATDGIVGPLTLAALDKAVPVQDPPKPVEPAPKPEEPKPAPVEPKPVPKPVEPKPEPKPEPEPEARKPISGYHMSKAGLDLLKHFEGLRLEPYWDNGELAIGYGHANHSKKPPIVVEGMKITEKEAEEILARDLVDYENRVKAAVKAPLYQHEFDALVSIAYNWGPGNLDRSILLQLVNAGQYKLAADEIRSILPSQTKKFYAGIKRRRGKEADLFEGK